MPSEPLILGSAYRHGVEAVDMLHAYRNPIRVFEQADDMTMYIGGSTNGNRLLEVGTLTSAEGDVFIAHAMLARRKYLR